MNMLVRALILACLTLCVRSGKNDDFNLARVLNRALARVAAPQIFNSGHFDPGTVTVGGIKYGGGVRGPEVHLPEWARMPSFRPAYVKGFSMESARTNDEDGSRIGGSLRMPEIVPAKMDFGRLKDGEPGMLKIMLFSSDETELDTGSIEESKLTSPEITEGELYTWMPSNDGRKIVPVALKSGSTKQTNSHFGGVPPAYMHVKAAELEIIWNTSSWDFGRIELSGLTGATLVVGNSSSTAYDPDDSEAYFDDLVARNSRLFNDVDVDKIKKQVKKEEEENDEYHHVLGQPFTQAGRLTGAGRNDADWWGPDFFNPWGRGWNIFRA